jgi:hypothetical protein
MTTQSSNRKYLPTLSDLIDRLTIVQQKHIFIPERREEYKEERDLLLHDINLLIADKPITAKAIWAITVLQLTNRVIWENESRIRDGSSDEPSDVQLKRLKLTHSINGIRNTAKNVIAKEVGNSRADYKIDALSADLPPEFGAWDIFPKNGD